LYGPFYHGLERNPFTAVSRLLELDLHVDTGGKVELHQRNDGLRRRVQNIEEPLVRPDLELLT
jgi:hypothetical protein